MKSEATLIEAIVRGVEDFLAQHQLSMAPARKAYLVRMLFVHFCGRADASSADDVERLLEQYWLEVERSLHRAFTKRGAVSILH